MAGKEVVSGSSEDLGEGDRVSGDRLGAVGLDPRDEGFWETGKATREARADAGEGEEMFEAFHHDAKASLATFTSQEVRHEFESLRSKRGVTARIRVVADESGDKFWERVRRLSAERGLTDSELSMKAFGARTSLSSAKSQGSIPGTTKLFALARVLSVSAYWLATGEEEERTAERPLESVLAAQDMSLVGFLTLASQTGLSRWAMAASRDETPTLAEAAMAVRTLQTSPQYSTSEGAPIDGWSSFMADLWSNKFRQASPAKKGTPDATVAKAIDDPLGGHTALEPSPHSAKRRGRK